MSVDEVADLQERIRRERWKLLGPPSVTAGDGETPTAVDPDAQVFGNWVIRPGEASFKRGPFFNVDGVRRHLLTRLAEAKGRTVSNNRLKEACGNVQMEDGTLRCHIHRLNGILKAGLGHNEKLVKAVKGAYRLMEPPVKPARRTQHILNRKHNRR
jgi:DNA-binding response OmpR family regulator